MTVGLRITFLILSVSTFDCSYSLVSSAEVSVASLSLRAAASCWSGRRCCCSSNSVGERTLSAGASLTRCF